ncbi:GTP-binding protein, partial [Toxoplasma gondii RUB]
VAAVGHSNVGKSSLLNALMHGRDVARSCSKP